MSSVGTGHWWDPRPKPTKPVNCEVPGDTTVEPDEGVDEDEEETEEAE